jgi:elongation factor P
MSFNEPPLTLLTKHLKHMLSINDLNPGKAIIFNKQPHLVVWREHAMMGRGGGFVRTKLRNLINGATIENTFKGNDRLEEADLFRTQAQFLYFEGNNAVFMDNETFDQFSLSRDPIGNSAHFLTEGMTVEVLSYEQQPIAVTIPTKVNIKVTYTEPGFKGNTASATTKPAKLETGAKIQVPLFINQGDTIRIDSRDGSYLERVK